MTEHESTTQSTSKPIYMKKGTIVKCFNGHEVYETTRDIMLYEVPSAEQFKGIGGIKSPNSEDIIVCPLCGINLDIGLGL